jgi:hypothetical protein
VGLGLGSRLFGRKRPVAAGLLLGGGVLSASVAAAAERFNHRSLRAATTELPMFEGAAAKPREPAVIRS